MANENAIQVYNINEHEKFLSKQKEKMDRWMAPGVDLRSEALMRHALHEMQLTPSLQACTPLSMYMALLSCAVLGLVPGKMRGLAYLIPFKNKRQWKDKEGNGHQDEWLEATVVVGWQGVKLMGFRAGIDMMSAVVHENDVFDYDKGTSPFVKYRAALRNAGAVIGAAAWTKLPSGSLEIEYLDTEELGKIEKFAKSKSDGKSPAWDGDFKPQMQRKSALRRLGKQVGPGLEFFKLEAVENAIDDGALSTALDQLTEGDATRGLERQLTEAAAFGEAPRTQVQVPAQLDAAKPAAKPAQQRAAKPVEAAAVERPTPSNTSPGSGATPTAGAGTTKGGILAVGGARPDLGEPAGGSATKFNAAVEASRGKANPTPPASPTEPPPSTDSGFPAATPSESSSSAPADVADEPPPSDTSFDTDGFDEPAQPVAPTFEGFKVWAKSCTTKAELNAGRAEWVKWSGTQDGKPHAREMKQLFDAALKVLP